MHGPDRVLVTLDAPAVALVATPTVTVTGTIDEPHLLELTVNGVAATACGAGYRNCAWSAGTTPSRVTLGRWRPR